MKSLPPSSTPDSGQPNELHLASINPRKETLTPDKFRELTGNPTLSDEEANQRIETTRKLVHIILEISRITNYFIDNQYIVNLDTTGSGNPTIPQIPPFTKTKAA